MERELYYSGSATLPNAAVPQRDGERPSHTYEVTMYEDATQFVLRPSITLDSTSMTSTSLDELPGAVWQPIVAASTKLLSLSVPRPDTCALPDATPVSNCSQPSVTVQVSVSFPAPHNITSDLVALGIRDDIARDVFIYYYGAILDVKKAYEEQYHRTNETCTRIASVAGHLVIAGLLSRLHQGFMKRYMDVQHFWTAEALSAAQRWLLKRSINSPRLSVVSIPGVR